SRCLREEPTAAKRPAAGLHGRSRELLDLHPWKQPVHTPGVEHASSEVLDRLRAARHREAEAVLWRAVLVPAGDVAREERVAGADPRARVHQRRIDRDAVEAALAVRLHQPDAAR